MESRPWSDYFAIALIALAAFACSLPAWFNGDDFVTLERFAAPGQHPFYNSLAAHVYQSDRPDHFYRPIANILLAALMRFDSALFLRLASLFLHLANGLFVWTILHRLRAGRLAAALGALFFLLNPAIHNSTMWISAVGDLLCALPLLAAIAIFLDERRSVVHTTGLLLACYFLGLLAKEMAITLPLLILVIGLARKIRGTVATVLVLLGAGVAYGLLRGLWLGTLLAGGRTEHYCTFGLRTLVAAVKYAGALLVPLPFDWLTQYPFLVLAGLALPAVWIVALFRLGARRFAREVLPWLLCVPLALLPTINAFADFYLYLPSAAWSVAAAVALRALTSRALRVAAVLYVGACAALTVYWSALYLQTRDFQETLLRLAHAQTDRDIALVGLPRQLKSIPLLTFEGHFHAALRHYYGDQKNVYLVAQTCVADLRSRPEVRGRTATRLELAFPWREQAYFDLEHLGAERYRAAIEILRRDQWRRPVSLALTVPPGTRLYMFDYGRRQLVEVAGAGE